MLPDPVRTSTAPSIPPTVSPPDPDEAVTGPASDAIDCEPEPVLDVKTCFGEQ